MARLLLTGFEPFGSFKRNPSWDALELAHKRALLPGVTLKLVRIPVTYKDAFAVFERAAKMFAPDVAVSFGVHGSRDARTIYLERTARNRNGAVTDNRGTAAPGIIVPRGKPEIVTRFPVQGLHLQLKEAGYAAEYSDDAGAYLCNNLYYRASRAFSRRFPVLFVHVPPVGGQGRLSLGQLARAVAIVAWNAAMAGTLGVKS